MGNDNSEANQTDPVYWYDALAVVDSDQRGARASFSNFGVRPDVAAPGIAVLSTMTTLSSTIQTQFGNPSLTPGSSSRSVVNSDGAFPKYWPTTSFDDDPQKRTLLLPGYTLQVGANLGALYVCFGKGCDPLAGTGSAVVDVTFTYSQWIKAKWRPQRDLNAKTTSRHLA
jgi:hypothetical protein